MALMAKAKSSGYSESNKEKQNAQNIKIDNKINVEKTSPDKLRFSWRYVDRWKYPQIMFLC